MFDKKLNFNESKISIILLLLSVILYFIICFNAFSKPVLGFDDYYTLGIVRFSFMDMINSTASNVHLPLYYIIFKIFKTLFHASSNFNLIMVGKFVSLIPLGLLMIFSWVKIRKEFGILVCGIFCLLLCSSFQIMNYSTVIRMYSWGLFFLTIQLFYAYKLFKYDNNLYWIIFTIAAICSSYTHYFSAISSIIIYLLLLFILYNKGQIKKWLISTAICILTYLPWLNILLSQISSVKNEYWIKPITIGKIFDYFQFIFSPMNNEIGTIFGIILFVTIIILIYIVFSRGLLSIDEKYNLFILFSLVFITIFTGIVLSFLIRPIFVERYIVPCLGSICLGFAILIDKLKNDKNIFLPLIVFILIFSLMGAVGFVNETNVTFEDSTYTTDLLNDINQNYNFVVINDPLSNLRYSPFLNNATVIFGDINTTISSHPNEGIYVIFDKHKDLENNTNFMQIGQIHQDKIYTFNNSVI